LADDRESLDLRIDCDVTSVRDTGQTEIPQQNSNLVFLFSRPLQRQKAARLLQSLSDGRSWLGHAQITEMTGAHWPDFRAEILMPWGSPASIEANPNLPNGAIYKTASQLTDGGGSVSDNGVCVMREEAPDRPERGQ
jgi:hypothetical protein